MVITDIQEDWQKRLPQWSEGMGNRLWITLGLSTISQFGIIGTTVELCTLLSLSFS